MFIPSTAKEVTPQWLSDRLGGIVTDCSLTPIGQDAGYTSDVMRVSVIGEDGLPDSIILKLAAGSLESRQLAENYFSYKKESRFYGNWASKTSIRTPRCYFNLVNESGSDMALGLEDLAQHRFVSQATGANREQVLAIIEATAGLHAQFWNESDNAVPSFQQTFEVAATELQHMIPDTLAEVPQSREVEDLLRYYADYSADHADQFTLGPQVLSHVDLRLDNVCFSNDGNEPIFFDWGDFAFGPPGFDVAYFLVTSCKPDVRRSVEQEAISLYHASLGQSDFSVGDCFDSYRLCIPATFYFPALMTAAGNPDAHQMVNRAASAVADHIDWLQRIYRK